MNERKRALRSELLALRARLSPDERAARSSAESRIRAAMRSLRSARFGPVMGTGEKKPPA